HHPAPTQIYTLSLHDALPILGIDKGGRCFGPRNSVWRRGRKCHRQTTQQIARHRRVLLVIGMLRLRGKRAMVATAMRRGNDCLRSEEHTSELQSLAYLVCRLL